MFFATTKGKFAALFLVASRFASASAAPAQADIAIYELADDISIAPHASPAIDAHLMLTELDADDFAEWSDIIAAVSNAEAFALSEHEDTDNDALKEVSFDRMPRCEGCGKRPIGRPKCPKCPDCSKCPKSKCPQCPGTRCPKCPKCKTCMARLRRPKIGFRIPIPKINIPGIGRLPLPKHIEIGISSKGSKEGSKSRVPSGRRLPLGSNPRTWSPSGKAISKGMGKGRSSVPRKIRGTKPTLRTTQRKGKGRTFCTCADVILEAELENADVSAGEVDWEQLIINADAADNSVDIKDTGADNEATNQEFDFAMEDFEDTEFEDFDDVF